MFPGPNLQVLTPYPAVLIFSPLPSLKTKDLPSFPLYSLSISLTLHFSTKSNPALLQIPLFYKHSNPWMAPSLLPSSPTSPAGNTLKVPSFTNVMSMFRSIFHSVKWSSPNAMTMKFLVILATWKLVNWLPPNSVTWLQVAAFVHQYVLVVPLANRTNPIHILLSHLSLPSTLPPLVPFSKSFMT